jgi:hypothetical protein
MKHGIRSTICMAGMVALALHAQSPAFTAGHRSVVSKEAVQYLFPEQIRVTAGKSSPVALHFRVGSGLHINSHDPKDSFLIATDFSIPSGTGVQLDGADYPPGIDFSPASDLKMKLNVYTGDFVIQTHITAVHGDHLVEAQLRFQACDENACMPPKTIPVAIDVIGK